MNTADVNAVNMDSQVVIIPTVYLITVKMVVLTDILVVDVHMLV